MDLLPSQERRRRLEQADQYGEGCTRQVDATDNNAQHSDDVTDFEGFSDSDADADTKTPAMSTTPDGGTRMHTYLALSRRISDTRLFSVDITTDDVFEDVGVMVPALSIKDSEHFADFVWRQEKDRSSRPAPIFPAIHQNPTTSADGDAELDEC